MSGTITIKLSTPEVEAILWAVGNMTDANARDIDEMMLCGMTLNEAKALLKAEYKIEAALELSKQVQK